ncbi:POK8 protein, partial [Columbina picui]|nr:POK8 protein [Columbina picui]
SWKYLGWILTETMIKPQPLRTNNDIKTLNNLQKSMGAINWLWPMLGISNHELQHL